MRSRRRRPDAGNAVPRSATAAPPGPAPRTSTTASSTASRLPRLRRRTDPTGRTRTRIVEDIPADLTPVVTEHTIHRDWCPHCQKQVEPNVPDALPDSTLGHRVVVLSAWLHYGLGTTTGQIVDVFNCHLHLQITAGGLTQMWHRLAGVLMPWYVQIHRHCLDAASSTPTRPAGGSTAGPTGCGASRRPTPPTT